MSVAAGAAEGAVCLGAVSLRGPGPVSPVTCTARKGAVPIRTPKPRIYRLHEQRYNRPASRLLLLHWVVGETDEEHRDELD
eukprot:1375791-Prymnesium_polylepis.2